jgi:hypothetical protein
MRGGGVVISSRRPVLADTLAPCNSHENLKDGGKRRDLWP